MKYDVYLIHHTETHLLVSEVHQYEAKRIINLLNGNSLNGMSKKLTQYYHAEMVERPES